MALDLALLLIAEGRAIYYTSLGPTGEIMSSLRNDDKSDVLLAYPGGRNKFVRVAFNETPEQGTLMPETVQETLR